MPNEDGNYSEKEFKGLMTDKQNEVRARQQAQADLAASKKENEDLNKRIKEAEASTAKVNAGNPEDIVTRADLTKALDDRDKDLTDKYTKRESEKDKDSRLEKIEASFEKAKEKHTEEKEGKGLDFDEVWEGAKRELAKNKALQGVITSAKNPGEEAYKIGLQDPAIAKRVALNKKNFPDQKRTPKVGMEGTEVPGQFFSQERVKGMTREEIKANLPAIRKSQEKWKK